VSLARYFVPLAYGTLVFLFSSCIARFSCTLQHTCAAPEPM